MTIRSRFAHLVVFSQPTNHLDLRAVKWLENWLLENVPTSILVVVSHDREFLDAICTDIIQITAGTLKYHAGDYSSFASATRDDKVMTEKKVSALSKVRHRGARVCRRCDLTVSMTVW